MKIFIDNIIFSLQNSGGISVVWYELIRRLINNPEFEIKFFDYPNKNIFRDKCSISEDKIINRPLKNIPTSIERYLNLSINKNSGLFHSSYYRSVVSANIANITTIHDFTYEYFRKGLPSIIHHIQKGNAIKNSKKIICVSQNTKADLMRFFPKISENQIHVIYNGVDEIYQPLIKCNESLLNELIPFSSGEFVLYVGDRKSKYKNFDFVVKACKIIGNPLVMIGGGLLARKEHQFLKDTLGENNFKLLIGINNELLNIIYNNSLCLLYPSLYEGFGIPILEAQRAGCPVISNNRSSIPEVAGKGAILLNHVTEYSIAEIIQLLKKDYAVVNSLREEGFKNSLRFSWDLCYEQTIKVYKEVYQENL